MHTNLFGKHKWKTTINQKPPMWMGKKDNRHVFPKRVGVINTIPHGLVMRLLLFLIYVYDLPKGLELYFNMFPKDAKHMRIKKWPTLHQPTNRIQQAPE